jgi:hypothetical protein
MTRRKRREFTISDRIAIVGRATDGAGKIHCEKCGRWCRKKRDYEIDHRIPEGMRPLADLLRKLTPVDGWLLCVEVCHSSKTVEDKGDIAKAKRREAAHVGVKPPRRKINWGHERQGKPPLKVAKGKSRIAREYGQ